MCPIKSAHIQFRSTEKNKNLRTDNEVHSEGDNPLYGALCRRGLDAIKLAYNPSQPDGWLKLKASAFTDFSQYASSPGCRAYCYAELAVSSPAVAETTADILIAPTHGGMARLSGPE